MSGWSQVAWIECQLAQSAVLRDFGRFGRHYSAALAANNRRSGRRDDGWALAGSSAAVDPIVDSISRAISLFFREAGAIAI